MSEESESEGGFGSEYSFMSRGFGPLALENSVYSTPKSDLSRYDSLYSYDATLRSLEASISASVAPVTSKSTGASTEYIELSGSAVTPVGGAEIHAGLYSDSYGMFGAYFSSGPAIGLPGGSVGFASGHTQSLAGESVSVSGGLSYGVIGISKGYSFNPSTGEKTGENWAVGLSVGPPIAASASYTSTAPSEFTSLYLAYLQFLNWVGYPGNSAVRPPGH